VSVERRRRCLTLDFHQGNAVYAAAGEDEIAVVRGHHVAHDTAA
jgi:hypothetical protein